MALLVAAVGQPSAAAGLDVALWRRLPAAEQLPAPLSRILARAWCAAQLLWQRRPSPLSPACACHGCCTGALLWCAPWNQMRAVMCHNRVQHCLLVVYD